MQRILIATDLTAAGTNALQRACMLASHECAALMILHVIDRARSAASQTILAEQLAMIAEAQAAIHPCIRSIDSRIAIGPPRTAITDAAEQLQADLIVVGAREQTRWTDGLFGSTVETIIRHTAIPVLVVRDRADRPYRRIIAAIDDGQLAKETFDLAATVASGQSLFAVHAFLPTVKELVAAHGDETLLHDAQQRRLETAARSALGDRRDISLRVHPIARHGDPVSVMANAWEEYHADLIVLVTRGRSGLALALTGSFADLMIEDGRFDLLIRHCR